MKRIAALLALMMVLSGCGAQNSPPPMVSASTQTNPDILPPPAPEKILYTVSTSTSDETIHTESGEVLLTSRYVVPSLTAHRLDGSPILTPETDLEQKALEVVDTFNSEFDGWNTEDDFGGGDIAKIAAEDYAYSKAQGWDWHNGYSLNLECAAYQTERMVSVTGLYYTFTGGAHPNSAHLAWNFDLENGAFFGPELLGGGTEMQTAVAEELVRQCQALAEENGLTAQEMFWADYETILADWPSTAVSFDEEGMTVSYSPYELAAYAAGPQIFEIGYEFLQPYLSLESQALLGLADAPGA